MRLGEVIGRVTMSQTPPLARSGTWLVVVPLTTSGIGGDQKGRGEALVVFDEGIDAALALTKAVPQAELVLYPGRQHLFAERGQPSYDAAATAAMTARVLAFLAGR